MAEFTTLTTYAVNCPACGCDRVVKDGTQRGQQRYRCRVCNKKFRANGKAQGRRMDADLMGSAIRDFYNGISYKKIAEGIEKEYNIPEPSKATVFEWVRDYTAAAIKDMKDQKAQTSGHWVADEMYIDVGGQKVYNWNVMDSGTRYILAAHLSPKRDATAARAVMRKALAAADKPPETITTDKWRAYLRPIRELMPDAKHIQSQGLAAEINNNMSERVQGTYRDRIKTLRGLDNLDSGQRYLDGWTINYNLFKKHHSLGNRTPADKARVGAPFRKWADVVKGDAASLQPVKLETRLVAKPRGKKDGLPEIQPPKLAPCKRADNSFSPIPPDAFAAMPKAMRPAAPKAKGRTPKQYPVFQVRERTRRTSRRGH